LRRQTAPPITNEKFPQFRAKKKRVFLGEFEPYTEQGFQRFFGAIASYPPLRTVRQYPHSKAGVLRSGGARFWKNWSCWRRSCLIGFSGAVDGT
jgi:hypothetical protein